MASFFRNVIFKFYGALRSGKLRPIKGELIARLFYYGYFHLLHVTFGFQAKKTLARTVIQV